MSRLLISLYLDEDVHVLVADLVRAWGFDAKTARECGQLGLPDPEQLVYAGGERRTLLTHNRGDFEALCDQYRTAGRKHYGVIIAVHRPPREIVRRLMAILDRLTADEMEDQLLYI